MTKSLTVRFVEPVMRRLRRPRCWALGSSAKKVLCSAIAYERGNVRHCQNFMSRDPLDRILGSVSNPLPMPRTGSCGDVSNTAAK